MKKIIYFVALILLCSNPLWKLSAATHLPTHYTAKQIKLGDYQYKNGKAASGTFSVPWWELEPFHVAVDDRQHIYVLDIYNKKVLLFSPEGKMLKEITLKDISFPYTNRNIDDGYMYYMIQVSSDGRLIYVTGGSNEYNWTIFDDKGNPVKKDISIFTLFARGCNDKFTTDDKVLDRNLNVVKEVTKHVYDGEIFDSTFNFYSLGQSPKGATPSVSKMTTDRRMVWKKEIGEHKKALRLLGVDGEDNIYILTDDPAEILRMDKNGELAANISFPSESLFEKSIFSKGIFRVLCDGTIYYFPPYLPGSQAKEGRYVIYKFEKTELGDKSNDTGVVKAIANAMQNKKYDGDSKLYTEQYINAIAPLDSEAVKKLFIKALRNEIYARHGRIFISLDMKQIFESAPWYKPKKDFKESDLNETEKKNVEIIFEYEKKMGWK